MITRELKRIALIVFLPIYLPLWILCSENSWEAVGFYFKAIFSKDLLLSNKNK